MRVAFRDAETPASPSSSSVTGPKRPPGFMMTIRSGNIWIWIGADNATQVAGSPGGVGFMIAAVLYVLVVIVLVGWPSSLYLFHQVRPRPYSPVQIVLMFGCFASAIVLSLSVWWQSMRSGVRALRQMDRTPA